VALFSWPVVTLFLYQRMTTVKATLWSILGAYLILPARVNVDFPMIPPLNKMVISSVSAFMVCRLVHGKYIKLVPNLGLGRVLFIVYIISPFVTAGLNPEPIVAGTLYIKGMEYYDALSAIIRQLFFTLPFLLGFSLIRDHNSHVELLKVLAIAGVFYSFPMLLEIRLSPQLHTWIYGFFPHSFIQQARGGGFRPVVFIGHGLLVAFFMMSSLVSVIALGKLGKTILGYRAVMVALYLGIVLVLCKSVASLIYALLAVSLIQLASVKQQMAIAKVLVILVMLYPVLRSTDWAPVGELVDEVAEISEQRAQSLEYRFDNEDLLLNHVNDRPFFGWGSWGRARVYDMKTGKDLSTTDGRWIIVMSEYGWVGFLAEFGLLIMPVFRCAKIIKSVKDKREKIVLGAMTLLLAISVVDLLPNASVSPWTWLLAGALFGRVEQIKYHLSQRA